MILYQYIGLIIGIIGIIVTFLRFKDGKMSLNMLLVWSAIWILLIVFSIYPDTTTLLASITGIGRGLDLILIIGLIGCYYFIFKIYNIMENIEEEITHLVREIALEKGRSEDKRDDTSPKDNK
ncbi:DUF2304 domain-containing protein [Methanobacterium sp.]|uniref:DUF2304 domain-containing protein n=1 Tax=Methanobacterium sp. TaxID=2164 RepID=UPI002AB9ECC4|nr:DUF2304 family protein [Methanobacterium sp.]MDY9923067.1 DUF2304 family protein [Methanobacterium sp.]